MNPVEAEYIKGKEYTISSSEDLGFSPRIGYEFLGWKDVNSEKTYQPNEKITIYDDTFGLSAVWKREVSYLCFTAQQANSTIRFNPFRGKYQTSSTGKDGSWKDYTLDNTITLQNVGDKIYFKARTYNETCTDPGGTVLTPRFRMTGLIACSGNIQSLLDQTCQRMDVPENCYICFFMNCTSLTQAPELPGTELSSNCYGLMFQNCTALTAAPELPAELLSENCYYYIFDGCTSFNDCYMKQSMSSIYNVNTHGDTRKIVHFTL